MMNEQVKYPRKWERIDNFTSRLKVPQGWIVHSADRDSSDGSVSISESMVFVPDMGHTWILEDE